MNGYDKKTIEAWKKAISPYRRSAPKAPGAQSALLIIDMQNYFASLCDQIVDVIRMTVETCHSLSIPVIFTQHGHADPKLDGGMLARWWGDVIIEGTPEHQLIDTLGREPGDVVVVSFLVSLELAVTSAFRLFSPSNRKRRRAGRTPI